MLHVIYCVRSSTVTSSSNNFDEHGAQQMHNRIMHAVLILSGLLHSSCEKQRLAVDMSNASILLSQVHHSQQQYH